MINLCRIDDVDVVVLLNCCSKNFWCWTLYEFWWLGYVLFVVVHDFFFLVFLMNVDECELKISKVEDEERKKEN